MPDVSKRDRTGVTRPTDHTVPHDIIAELTVIDCDGREAGEDMDVCLKCEQGQLRMLHLLAVEVEGLRAAADAIADIRSGYGHPSRSGYGHPSRDDYDRGKYRAADECCDAITDAYAKIEKRLEAGE